MNRLTRVKRFIFDNSCFAAMESKWRVSLRCETDTNEQGVPEGEAKHLPAGYCDSSVGMGAVILFDVPPEVTLAGE